MVVEEEVVSGVSALLGYYAALIGSCVPTFRDNVSVQSSRVMDCLTVEDGAYQSIWKMRAIGCTETSVHKYHRCVTSQKRESLTCTAAEAWNHPKLSLLCYCARNYRRRERSTHSVQLHCRFREGNVAYFKSYFITFLQLYHCLCRIAGRTSTAIIHSSVSEFRFIT
jgi:hypothetical protein